MNRLLLSSLLFALLAAPLRAEEARWIRYPALSPDGTKVVFSHRGDLWIVPRDGGEARPLTTHVGYEKFPVWSPDSKWIAFASDRFGNFDLFYVSADGGPSKRLTFHSATDRPACFSRDGKHLLFTSSRQDAPQASLGTTFLSELYSVSLEGGRPSQLCTTPTEAAQLSPDGRHIAYQDLKGYESYWRKHHVSSVARDIWIWNRESGKHRKITTFRGEDRNPVWAPDGKQLFFLSESAGTFNVWMLAAPFDGEPVQITRHTPHPVRFLSAADDGTLCYGYNGELWLRPKGGESRRVNVTVRASERENSERPEVLRKGATGFSVSPNGKEIAFVVRGEVFVTSVEHGTTRRITDSGTARGTSSRPRFSARRNSTSFARRCSRRSLCWWGPTRPSSPFCRPVDGASPICTTATRSACSICAPARRRPWFPRTATTPTPTATSTMSGPRTASGSRSAFWGTGAGSTTSALQTSHPARSST
ncbi:MAG: hypothetical protein ACYSX0_22220 [Planctomycetota bacterium]|jgi:Tol biopolymer transport system component